MIKNVVLVNFISHGRTTLPLGEGITVFVGKNGAGKSSIIDGITYALYGKHSRGDNAGLVKERAESAAVALEFSSGGRRYRVERKVNKKGQLDRSLLVEVLDGGEVRQIAAGERKQFGESLTGEIAKIMGLNYEQMIIAGIIQQGELDSIIDLKAKDLKDLVNSAIGIDRLDTAYNSMREVVDSFRDVVRNKYGYDDQDLPKISSQLAQTETSLQEGQSKLQKIDSELQALKADETSLEDEIKRLEPLRQKAEVMRIKFEELIEYVRGRQEDLAEEQRSLEAEVVISRKSLALLSGERGIEEREDAALGERKDCEALLNDLSGAIAALEAQKGRPEELGLIIKECREALLLAGRADVIRNGFQAAEARIHKLDDESARTQEEIGRFEANQDTAQRLEFRNHICPICGSHVEKINELFDSEVLNRHLREHRAKLKELGEEKRKTSLEFKSLQEEKVALDRTSKLLGRHRIVSASDVDRLEAEKEELQSSLQGLPKLRQKQEIAKERKVKAEGALAELRRRREEVTTAKAYLNDHGVTSEADVQRLVAKLEGLRRTIGSIPKDLQMTRKLEDLGALSSLSVDEHSARLIQQVGELREEASRFDEKAYAAKLAELDEVTKVRIPKKSSEEGRWKNQAEEAEKNLKVLKAALAELQEVSEFVGLLERIRSRVYHRDGGVSTSVRSWALTQLSKKASEYARLFEIGVSSITIKETGRDMEIDCYGPRGHVRTSSMSGGEKVAIALALRFALAYVMGGYKLDFIILDEPTVHLDAERKAKLVNIISRLGGEESPLKQIVIITHDSEIFDNADVDEVWRFESAADGSHVTRGLEDDVAPGLGVLSQ